MHGANLTVTPGAVIGIPWASSYWKISSLCCHGQSHRLHECHELRESAGFEFVFTTRHREPPISLADIGMSTRKHHISTITKIRGTTQRANRRPERGTRRGPLPPAALAGTPRPSSAVAGACLSLCVSLFAPSMALAASDATVQVFQNSCAGCHAGGGNIVKRDATLALSDLQKYGLDGPDQLYDIIYKGRGSMPGFGEGCTPKGACTFAKRLTDDQIRDLAGYILEQPW